MNSTSCGICLSFESRYFSRVMVKRFTLQLYRTTFLFAQLWMAASNHLINKCDQKIRQVENQLIKHQIRRKTKATRLEMFLSSFFKWLESVLLGELQIPIALQYRFKIFSGSTKMNANQNGAGFFSNYL